MFRPLASLLHRSGVLPAVRRTLGIDNDGLRKEFARDLKTVKRESQQANKEILAVCRDLQHEVRVLRAVLAANSARPFAHHPDAMDASSVAAHVRVAVAAAPLLTSPTAHVVIDRLLPEPTYRALVDATPPDECFSTRDTVKQNFRPGHGQLVPEFTTAMWSFMDERIIPDVLVPALIEKFRPYLQPAYEERYGGHAAAVAALPHRSSGGRLMLRRPGYHLEPHLDPRRVIITCLLYIARPGDDTSFGTQFFSVNDTPRVDRAKTYYPREAGYACTLEKTVPFLPNIAVAFLNAGPAAHGATIPKEAPPATKRYAFQFYISPDPVQLAAITGESPDALD